MNQIKPTVNYAQSPDRKTLTKTDATALHKALVSGDHALSKKSDLVELHKRMVAMFATLKDGLGEISETKAAQDREAVCTRLDEIELAMNSMEGLLRIEMAPKIRAMLNEVLEEMKVRRERRWPRVVSTLLFLGVGLGLGAVYAEVLLQLASTTVTGILAIIGKG